MTFIQFMLGLCLLGWVLMCVSFVRRYDQRMREYEAREASRARDCDDL